MMTLELLPAGDGDCLLLSYGEGGKLSHVLIDGGRSENYSNLRTRIVQLHEAGGKLELLVCTHYDADHIGGLIELASDTSLPLIIDEVWFNGFDQVSSLVPMGPRQADQLSDLMKVRGWLPNRRFGGGPVMISGAPSGSLVLSGGLQITLLSPDVSGVERLFGEWDNVRNDAAVTAGGSPLPEDSFFVPMSVRKTPPVELDITALADSMERPDRGIANGASIAFLAEFMGKRLLVTADAHPSVLARSIRHLSLGESGRLRVDLLKVPHHGSLKNTTRELAGLLDCNRFAFSTDGGRHDHPAPEAVAKLLASRATEGGALYFNYRQAWADCWAQPDMLKEYSYSCHFPEAGDGILIEV